MLILGLSGWMRRGMSLLPMPIVMAILAGVFLQFGLNLIFAIRDGFFIAAPMTIVFLLLTVVPALGRNLPPLIGALVTGIVAVALSGSFELGKTTAFTFANPNLYVPEFSWPALRASCWQRRRRSSPRNAGLALLRILERGFTVDCGPE